MFDDIPRPILERMHSMEKIDERDRVEGTPTARRLRQIPPETGHLIALLATGAPPGEWIEIGTSGGQRHQPQGRFAASAGSGRSR